MSSRRRRRRLERSMEASVAEVRLFLLLEALTICTNARGAQASLAILVSQDGKTDKNCSFRRSPS